MLLWKRRGKNGAKSPYSQERSLFEVKKERPKKTYCKDFHTVQRGAIFWLLFIFVLLIAKDVRLRLQCEEAVRVWEDFSID